IERTREREILKGDVPSPINTPPGCKFQNRCKYVKDICRKEAPILKEVKPEHYVACHLVK
ncbi:oligopeptide/dipeptide ABC transporter ATP-binding protein, partial [Dethiothermospora halolimnae]|uniref:oligopeptide/dipeptide ABC transporter ATP-binding protein n=1 Tax=Dethiothermospora halolimnae TaxID=3114390 RepID=UPI003CCBF94E